LEWLLNDPVSPSDRNEDAHYCYMVANMMYISRRGVLRNTSPLKLQIGTQNAENISVIKD